MKECLDGRHPVSRNQHRFEFKRASEIKDSPPAGITLTTLDAGNVGLVASHAFGEIGLGKPKALTLLAQEVSNMTHWLYHPCIIAN